jgi:hypothetical protein
MIFELANYTLEGWIWDRETLETDRAYGVQEVGSEPSAISRQPSTSKHFVIPNRAIAR